MNPGTCIPLRRQRVVNRPFGTTRDNVPRSRSAFDRRDVFLNSGLLQLSTETGEDKRYSGNIDISVLCVILSRRLMGFLLLISC